MSEVTQSEPKYATEATNKIIKHARRETIQVSEQLQVGRESFIARTEVKNLVQ